VASCNTAGVVMVSGAMTSIVYCCVVFNPDSSAALTVNVNVPSVVGVPVMVAEIFGIVLSESPGGSDPAEMDHVVGPLPLVNRNAPEYDLPPNPVLNGTGGPGGGAGKIVYDCALAIPLNEHTATVRSANFQSFRFI